MLIRSTILFACVYSAQVTAVATNPPGHDLVDECYAYSQAGITQCLTKNLRKSLSALRIAEEKATTAISKWDEDDKYIAAAKQRLQASNTAFGHYRTAQCAFAYSLGGGAIGNALDMRRLSCEIELNLNRANEISAATSPLPAR